MQWKVVRKWLCLAAVLPGLLGCQLLSSIAATSTAIPTATSPPTRPATMTPIATPSPAPTLSQETLIERWKTPMYVTTLLVLACNEGTSAAEAQVNGQAGETETLSAVLALRLLMGVAQGGLDAWQPEKGPAAFKPEMQAHAAAMNEVFIPWSDGALNSAQAADQLEPECQATRQTLDDIAAAARMEGLSQASLDRILEEIRQNVEGLGAPAIPEPSATPATGGE